MQATITKIVLLFLVSGTILNASPIHEADILNNDTIAPLLNGVQASDATVQQGASGILSFSCNCPNTETSTIQQGTTFNLGVLNELDPIWNRFGNTDTPSGINSYYDVFAFRVSTAGHYTFNGCFPTIDAYGHLFQKEFNPTIHCSTENFVVGDDDGYSTCSADPSLGAMLTPGVTYYLVSTSAKAFASDTYSWTFTGPEGATLYSRPNELFRWYASASNGQVLGIGSLFNPVGIANSGLFDTNTPGVYTYYASCANMPDSRTPIHFTIKTGTSAAYADGNDVFLPSGTTVTQGHSFNMGVISLLDSTWNRPGTDCTPSGVMAYYDVISFQVSTAGSYTFNGCFPAIDAYGHLFQHTFNPAKPCEAGTFLSGDDDSYTTCYADPSLTATLTPGVTYYLVSTTSKALVTTDSYSWTFTGPADAVISIGRKCRGRQNLQPLAAHAANR